jgi:hypothetical protein
MLRRGLASEARNAATVAGVSADRAQELEAAARTQEKHERALTEETAEQVVGLIRAMFAAVDLSLPHDLARTVLKGEEVTPELREQARAQLHRQVCAEVRSELRAELEAERRELPEEESATEVESNPPEDAETVTEPAMTFDELPPEWQQKYMLARSLGVREYLLATRRGERERAEGGGGLPRRAPRPSFRHPALEHVGW